MKKDKKIIDFLTRYMLPVLLLIAVLKLILPSKKPLAVMDGDTYIINGDRIRLLGVDCPELSQEYGHEAKMHVWGLLKGAEIKVDRVKKDKYGRWLSHVYFNNTPLDSVIVVNGWGWADTYNHVNEDLMVRAKVYSLGLWGRTNIVEPYKFRDKH
jgi:micrococcal nuclease